MRLIRTAVSAALMLACASPTFAGGRSGVDGTLDVTIVGSTGTAASSSSPQPVAIYQNGAAVDFTAGTAGTPAGGYQNVFPDGTADGASGTCSSTGTGAQNLCASNWTAAALAGFGSIQFSYTSIGSGATGGTIQSSQNAGSNFNTNTSEYLNLNAPAAAQGIATGSTICVNVTGNNMQLNLTALSSGTVTVVYVLKRTTCNMTNLIVSGQNGDNSSYSGNSVPVGGIYKTTYTALTTGQKGVLALDPYGQITEGPYGAMQTPIGCASATTGNTGNTCTLTGAASKFTYITSLTCSAGGATGASLGTMTITGLVGGTQSYAIAFPAGVSAQATFPVFSFNKPVQSSAVNTNIVITLPAGGSGNTFEACNANGFTQ